MVHTFTYKNVTWVDLEKPTRDEIREIAAKYDIHPLAAEELLLPSVTSKVVVYPDTLHVALHFPAWKHSHTKTDQEIDFIVGKTALITSRSEAIDPVHKFGKMFEVNSALEHNNLIGEHGGYALYYLLREIYRSLGNELEAIKDNLDDIEKKIFSGKERDMVFEISNVWRKLLSFKHALSFHKETLESFAVAAKAMFGNEFGRYTDLIENEYQKVNKSIQGLSESLHEMRETNNALLGAKQNQSIMTLTGITFITAILGIPIALFEIDFKYAPIVGMPNDFWIFGGIIACLGIGFAAVLAHKKWL